MTAAGLVAAAAALSGCMSGPTYGTDKTSSEQLVGDVSNILSLGPPERPAIDYKPRPDLVKPAKGEAKGALPAPQESVASTANPAWPESPEQKRARLRADADENRDNPFWKPQIEPDMARANAGPTEKNPVMNTRHLETGVAPVGFNTAKQQNEAFRKKLAQERQGSPTTRRYLSEPPLDYRQASATAPTGDLGEDEIKKERRLKAAARKKNDRSWADILPW
ncbi:hypothetical protein [Kumtagia ephedrae]|uniref:hypothetical protein n=1 Tax=Kumtagia ephedrae TaxID=2116701 RepID=UPI001FDF7317|nr:hypothetical protein [Mesorhizobium ephedrae]